MSGAERYESVTAILSGGVPKPALTRWAALRVAECAAHETDWLELPAAEQVKYLKDAPWREASDAADLGSLVHSYIERANLGVVADPSAWPLPVRRHMEHFTSWCASHRVEWEAAEMRVYNRSLRYAGTLDGICVVDGRRLLVDVKSGKGVYPEVALQLVAYARAEFCVADNRHPGSRQVTPARGRRWYEWHGPPEDELPMPQVDGAIVLHIRPDGLRVIDVQIDDDAWAWFLNVRAVDEFTSVGKRLIAAWKAVAA